MIRNDEILQIAMEQSAIDSGCAPEDFLARENKVVLSRQDPRARKYLELPFSCDLTSYGGNIVASVSPELRQAVESYINRYPAYHCFETPHLYVLNRALAPYDQQVCFMAEYFLPDVERLRPLPCGFSVRVLEPAEFQSYYLPQWSNALCEKRKHLDVLAVGAFDGERLIGLAGCSAGLREHVADRHRRPAGIPAPGHCLGPYQPVGGGSPGKGKSSLFTAVPGPMWPRPGTPSAAGSARPGCSSPL